MLRFLLDYLSLHKINFVVLWLCGFVACGFVALLLVAFWLSGFLALLLVALWLCGFVALWLCGFVALWLVACGFVAFLPGIVIISYFPFSSNGKWKMKRLVDNVVQDMHSGGFNISVVREIQNEVS